MEINDEIRSLIKQTRDVSFLTEEWERVAYLSALYLATQWGKKRTQENKEYFSKNHLIDKYNV